VFHGRLCFPSSLLNIFDIISIVTSSGGGGGGGSNTIVVPCPMLTYFHERFIPLY
jgi:hypothetical protein